MKLTKVEQVLDGSKLIFYFTAEGRVDFRELVRDLAAEFRTRIEMRQIGVRDEAKMIGGYGTCGRPLCCTTFLTTFEPVSIKMAKQQDLSLNPSKLSGLCGRLKCCLRYEYATYVELKRPLPNIGKRVECVKGSGKVLRQNILKQTVLIQREDDGGVVEVTLEDLVETRDPNA
jgi:cell fate regulator YaaT (PSP1 superfamily)